MPKSTPKHIRKYITWNEHRSHNRHTQNCPINLLKKVIEHSNIQFTQLNMIWVQAQQKESHSKFTQIEKIKKYTSKRWSKHGAE